MNAKVTALLTSLCSALDQNELVALGSDSKLLALVEQLQNEQLYFIAKNERNMDGLLSWFKNNNGVCNSEFTESCGYGMKMKEDAAAGDTVVKVPEKCFILADCSNNPDLNEMCTSDTTLCYMPNICLALNLLNERLNPNSFWKPYLDSLPQSYSSLLYFKKYHFDRLTPSPTFVTCARLYCKLVGLYVYLCSKLFKSENNDAAQLGKAIYFTPNNFTFQAFRWAMSTVMTRQNNVPIGGGLALVPILDMLNHDPAISQSVDYDDDARHVVVYAPKSMQKGEEMKIFYGPRPNHDLFVHNGFAMINNPYDSYYFQLKFQMVENEDEKRLKIISRLGIEKDCFKLTLAQPLPKSLLACIHIEFAPDNVVEKWLTQSVADTLDEVVVEKPKCLDVDICRKAYVWLVSQLAVKLRVYKETLANSGQAPDEISIHINTLVNEEKMILESTVEKLKVLLQK